MAKKPKAARLPKRIVGIKLNKRLRRGPIADMIMSPFGQNLIAEMVYHAGANIAGQADDSRPVRKAKRGLKHAGYDASNLASDAAGATVYGAGRVAHAFSAAAHTFVDTLRNRGIHDERADLVDDDKTKAPTASETRLADEMRGPGSFH